MLRLFKNRYIKQRQVN